MKKVCIICMLIFGLMTSIVFAENKIDENKWFWVFSDDKTSLYIDKQSIEYDPATDSVKLWVRANDVTKKLTTMELMQIYYADNTISSYDFAVYKEGNNMPIEHGDMNIRKEKIIPNTLGEMVKNKSLTLINRDEELAKYKEQQEAEAKEAEQEQKDKEKEQRNKEIANTAIGIIGGLF